MGQVIGKAAIDPSAVPFVGLPRRAIVDLFDAYHSIAEGYGITTAEVTEIVQLSLGDYLADTSTNLSFDTSTKSRRIALLAKDFFVLLDSDQNALIDTFEFLSTLVLLSACTATEKIKFILQLYEFEDPDRLSAEEVILALRAAVLGLDKVVAEDACCSSAGGSKEKIINRLALAMFQLTFGKDNVTGDDDDDALMRLMNGSTTVGKASFLSYILSIPEAISWIKHVDCGSSSDDKQNLCRTDLAGEIESDIKNTETIKLLSSLLSRACDNDGNSADAPGTSSFAKLDWVHGRNTQCCGNGAFYVGSASNADKGQNQWQVAYPAGSVLVKATYGGDFGDTDATDVGEPFAASIDRQQYFTEHSGYVSAMAVHNPAPCSSGSGGYSSDSVVATAHIGSDASSSIKIWSTRTMMSIATISLPNICMLEFSPSGDLLLAVGFDEMHSITVYKWKDRSVLYSSVSTSRVAYDCSFLGQGASRFGLCGDGFVHFWELQPGTASDCDCAGNCVYERQVGVFGNKIKPSETMTCLTSLPNVFNGDDEALAITGSGSGVLCVWEGRSCVQSIPVGTCGSITRLARPSDQSNDDIVLCVATSDGRIHVFATATSTVSAVRSCDAINLDTVLELRMSLSVASLGISGPLTLNQSCCIDSICLSPAGEKSKLLVGLRSSALFEMDICSGRVTRVITQCHGDSGGGNNDASGCDAIDRLASLTGLAANPIDADELATAGSDGLLCLWDVPRRKPKRTVVLDSPASCVCYSSDGSRILVGLAGTSLKKAGSHIVLCAKELAVLKRCCHSQQGLTECQSSLDGKYYAFASKDSNIYVYDARNDELLHKLRGHNDAVIKILFGQIPAEPTSLAAPSSTFLQSWSSNGEILFWNAETGKKCTYSSQRRTQWDDTKARRGSLIHSVGVEDCCLFQWRLPEDDQVDYLLEVGMEPPLKSASIDTLEESANHAADALCRTGRSSAVAIEDRPQRRHVTVPSSSCTECITARRQTGLPRSELELEFVHGCSAGTTGSKSLFYASNDDGTSSVIYPVGKTLVRSTSIHSSINLPESMSQMFHQECTGEISNVVEHPTLPLCAVSYGGGAPAIHIVDYRKRRQMINTIQIFHLEHPCKKNCLRFDKQGQHLVVICQNKAESLLVVDWRSSACIASTPTRINGHQVQTNDVAFLPNGAGIVQCGVYTLFFWSWSGGGSLILDRSKFISPPATRKSGGGDGDEKDRVHHSIGFIGNQTVIGTDDGCLLTFNKDHILDATVKAHPSAILAISSSNGSLASGCGDGVVKVWRSSHQSSLCCVASFDVVNLSRGTSINSAITNLCLPSESFKKILVGTASNEIWEVRLPAVSDKGATSTKGPTYTTCTGDENENENSSFLRATPLVQGYHGNQSIGLSVNPTMSTWATVAGDAMLRVWDVYSHKLLRSTSIEMAARACAHSPDGAYIAIGFGATRKRSAAELHGKISFIRESDLEVQLELRDSRSMITEMKWSASSAGTTSSTAGTILAVGSMDTCIYLYRINPSSTSRLSARLVRKIDNAFTTFISNIDFSVDGRYIAATCGSGTLNWFDTESGSQMPEPPLMATLQGSTEVTAFGNAAGQIHLSRHSCMSVLPAQAQSKLIDAHCGPVAKARFIGNGSHLVTAGKTDQSIMLWRHIVDDATSDDNVEGSESNSSGSIAADCCCCCEQLNGAMPSPSTTTSRKRARAWIRSCIEPSHPDDKDAKDEMPEKQVGLAFLHGMSSICPVSYNSNGDIVSVASRLGVVYDKERHEQRFFSKHNGEITALATSTSNGQQLVATGDDEPRPTVRVWNASTCQELCCLTLMPHQNHPHRRRRIAFVAFSPDSTSLLAVAQGTGDDNIIFLWTSFSGQWKDEDVVLRAKATCGEPISFAFFGCQQENFSGSCLESADETRFDLVTGGKNSLTLWTRRGSHLLQTRSPKDVQPMHCGALLGKGFFLTGTERGLLYLWDSNRMVKSIEAHKSQINCIQMSKCGEFLATGGNDASVKIWRIKRTSHNDCTEKLLPCLVLQASVGVSSPVRSIAIDPHLFHPAHSVRRLLVVTDRAELCELSAGSGDVLCVQRGHSSSCATGPAGGSGGELWGLATHPTDADTFATVGDDRMLRLWSIKAKRMVKEASLGLPARALCFSSNGQTILVGCGNGAGLLHSPTKNSLSDGYFLLIDTASLQVIHKRRDTSSWIREASFGPNDELFALAAADKKIYIYRNDASQRFKLKCILQSHTAPITSLDFSSDGSYIQSTSSEGELLVHNTEYGDVMALPSQLKTVRWASVTSTYGWPVQGLWPSCDAVAASEINVVCDDPISVDRSRDGKYLVACSSSGKLQLLHYPVTTRPKDHTTGSSSVSDRQGANADLGHSPGRNAKCRFSCDGNHVITAGREDCVVMVWAVE